MEPNNLSAWGKTSRREKSQAVKPALAKD